MVTPLKGSRKIPLPSTYVHNRLPDVCHEIPSQEDVESTPGLEHLATHFHQDPNWSTILLIGRDCAIAQTQEENILSTNSQQLASKTPLGWVIIGKQSSTPTSKSDTTIEDRNPIHPHSNQEVENPTPTMDCQDENKKPIPRCPNDHVMELGFKNDGFICDTCEKDLSLPESSQECFWHCHKCSHDSCFDCYPISQHNIPTQDEYHIPTCKNIL